MAVFKKHGIGIDIVKISRIGDQHKAGMWAANEAVFKATGEHIAVKKDENGRPYSEGVDISITHDGEYAIAVAMVI